MIKYLIASIALVVSVFATELTIRLLPEARLADLIPGNPGFHISCSVLDGRTLFNSLSKHIISNLPNKNVTFECLDFKFMSADDLSDICHNHIFVNKGTLDIIAHGSELGSGAFHVNLYLPTYLPVDEHTMFPAFQTSFDKMKMSALTSSYTMLSRLMKKTFTLPEDHPLMTLSKNSDVDEIEEKTWQLEFASFSMLYDLKARLKEFVKADPICYGKVFKQPIQLIQTMKPRTFLYYRGQCDSHIADHLRNKAASKSKKLDQKSEGLLKLQRELELAAKDRVELDRRIQIVKAKNIQLEDSLKRSKEEKDEMAQNYEQLKADREDATADNISLLEDKKMRDQKIEDLERQLVECNESIGILEQKLEASEKVIESHQGRIASQRKLISNLRTSCELGVSFTNLIDMPSGPEEMRNMVKWTHTAARFESLGNLSEYDEGNLGPDEKKAMRRLWLETYYSEGVRLRNWLSLAKSGDWRDVFMFEACFTALTEKDDEEKIKRKLGKMKNDIIRLESRVMEIIDALQKKYQDATEHEDITAFKTASDLNANSALDVEIYIKAFNTLQH